MTTSKSNDPLGLGVAQTQGRPTNILSPGTLIGGKFRIEDRIARGGQASVYLARQEPLNRPVALKLLSPPSLEATEEERESFEQRFLLEARTLAGLIALVRDNAIAPDTRTLFFHTGGGPALFAYEHLLQLNAD